MFKSGLCLTLTISAFAITANAQLPYEFTRIARNSHYGEARDVSISADGTVFLANGRGGLRAYSYDGSVIKRTALIDDGGFANAVALATDGTVFLANGEDGLRAYRYDGTTFTNTAHINNSVTFDGGFARSVAVGADGTIFLANNDAGLWAYTYDGTAFTNTASVGRGNSDYVAIGPDGTIFLLSIPGLWAYTYDGHTFTNTAYVRVEGYPQSVTAGSDGTVLLANGQEGLWAYTYDGTTFTLAAQVNDGGRTEGVTVASDGTIFVADREEGLFAYRYSGFVTAVENSISAVPEEYGLAQNYPNPFNPATIINFNVPLAGDVDLKIYNQQGRQIRILVDRHYEPGENSVTWDGRDEAGRVVPSGIYFYRLQVGDFSQVRKMTLLH